MTLKIERQDYPAPCDHPNRGSCHAEGPDQFGEFWHEVRRWHIWDSESDDYAPGTGPHEFGRRTDAIRWVATHRS